MLEKGLPSTCTKGRAMNRQTIEHRGAMVAAAAATAVASGLLGAAVAGGDDQAESNPATLTTEEEGTDSPEDPSGLEQTNSFGYIPEHETTLETDPIGPRVAASRTTRSNSAAGASTRPSSSRCPQTRPSPPRPVERRRHMTPTNHSPLPRRIAVGAVAALAVASLGLAGCDRASQTANHGFPQQPTSTTDETGLQQTNSFGYIPEHETTLPTNGNGPGAPGPFNDNPFDNPGPPLPGGPGLPAHGAVQPTLTTPAG